MVALTKKDIRQAHTAARKKLSAEHKAAKDAALADAILPLLDGKKIAAYHPLPSEPGGEGFVEKLHAAADEVWLPLSGAEGELTWCLYQGPDSMVPGALGILEPLGEKYDSTKLAELDIIFAPALAVDQSGMRLGKGAGYYDRALAAANPRPHVIAVLYAEEVIEKVPHHNHDQPVDAVITD